MRLALFLVVAGVALPAFAQLEPQPRVDDEAAPPPLPPARLASPPELLVGADPVYPDDAKAAGRTGQVALRIVIDEDGYVARVDVATSAGDDVLGRALDWAAMGAALNFEFAPAQVCTYAYGGKDGRTPVESCGPQVVAIDYATTFALQEQVVEVPVEDAAQTAAQGGPLNFEGVVRESGSKDPLGGVEIEIELPRANVAENAPAQERYEVRTTTSDDEGRFTFRGIPDGEHRVSFALSGYDAAFIDESFTQKDKTTVVVYLNPKTSNKFETVVRRRRAQKDVAKVSLSRDEVRRIPGTFGDPLRVIENLPGLARAPFIGGALIVRGANPNDTGVYFDGVEIPLLYHFGGLTSVVNAEFLEDIAFYPGGFGAYYGRATAGIVDVSSRRLKFNSCRGYAEADVIDSGFFLACPVQIGALPKVTFGAAARRSWVDAIIPVVLDTFLGTQQAIVATPVYWDYQTKLETTPVPGSTFSLFAFGSDDDLRVLSRNAGSSGFGVGFHTSFHRMLGRWEWKLSPTLRHVLQPYVGLTSLRANADNSGDQGGPQTSIAFNIDTWNWGIRDELAWTPNDSFTLRAGLDYLGRTFGTRFKAPLPLEIGSFPRQFPRVSGTEQEFGQSGFNNANAVYVESELTPVPGLKLVPGVRLESTTLTYLPDDSADGSQTTATETGLFHIDPRLTARFAIVPGTTLKGAAGVFRQAPQPQQANPDTGNPELLEPRAVQLIGGIEQALTKNINLDVQLYWTNRDLLVQSTSAVRAIANSDEVDPIRFNNGGRGNTIGAELLLRHEITENFFGWIAYTLSRTVVDTDENSSRLLVSDNDQTHILTLVAQWQLPWAFTLGGRFRAVSGTLDTFPLGAVHDIDTTSYLGLGGVRERLPFFHQLDVRIDRKWVFEQFSATTYLDVLNVYNHENSEGVQADYRSRELNAVPSLPFIPVFGLSAEF